MRFLVPLCGVLILALSVHAGPDPDKRLPLFAYLTGSPTPRLVTYTPSELDPRQEANQRKLATSSIRADLQALRPAFDGLVLYGYHEACTPRILAVAKDLKFHAVLLAVWDPKSAGEVDGVAALVRQYEKDFTLGVLVGNEGLTFKRYEAEDLTIAAGRLRSKIPKSVAISTSEPLVGYNQAFVRDFGDFVAPNIHPVFDRPQLGPSEAAAWTREQAVALAVQTKRPVILKETGFPHGGKTVYTPETQKAFWAAYLKPGLVERPAAAPQAWCYFGTAFDAFNLPWKTQATGLQIERYWGLFTEKREALLAFDVWRAARGGKQ
jgi:exo-beta-1,3-glucanase (GH17 family)